MEEFFTRPGSSGRLLRLAWKCCACERARAGGYSDLLGNALRASKVEQDAHPTCLEVMCVRTGSGGSLLQPAWNCCACERAPAGGYSDIVRRAVRASGLEQEAAPTCLKVLCSRAGSGGRLLRPAWKCYVCACAGSSGTLSRRLEVLFMRARAGGSSDELVNAVRAGGLQREATPTCLEVLCVRAGSSGRFLRHAWKCFACERARAGGSSDLLGSDVRASGLEQEPPPTCLEVIFMRAGLSGGLFRRAWKCRACERARMGGSFDMLGSAVRARGLEREAPLTSLEVTCVRVGSSESLLQPA